MTVSLEYIFHKGKEHFVTVYDEIEFIKNYLSLNDLFIHEIDAIKIDTKEIDDEILNSENYKIPHLITAYFLENAFKHGDKNHPEFLQVKITLNKNFFELLVVNKIKPNSFQRKTTGIGLENMKKRLNLFVKNNFEIKNSCNEQEYFSKLRISFT